MEPSQSRISRITPLLVLLLTAAGCGGDGHQTPDNSEDAGDISDSGHYTQDSGNTVADGSVDAGDVYTIPSPPVGAGAEATIAPPTGVLSYVDTGATNIRDNPCNVTLETNAGVRVLRRFLDIWTPSSLLVDAGVTLASANGCAAVTPSTWTGIPGDQTDGTILNMGVHTANIAYVEGVTQARTPAQELAAYLDDRRKKGYSVSDGFGPLTSAWRAGAQQTTSITAIAPDATTVLYNDSGNNLGVGNASNPELGLAVDFIDAMSGEGSTEPAKRFYKYARPWRWSTNVIVAPSLVPAKSATPATDGGFTSGHTAEAWRDSIAMAYLVPQRFQELITRAFELGENRILSGMHSPLDVMSGRIQATAVVAYNLNKVANATLASSGFAQAQSYLMAETGASTTVELDAMAHSGGGSDRFADYEANRDAVIARSTYGFAPISSTSVAPIVPRGAEVLLATRLPYLTAAQRRVVLATTELSSGFPLVDDDEGWGRLNLFAAADGYGAFNGDVNVEMDASQGGFSALDRWRNHIAGPGMLTKRGTGTLRLAGTNSYSGGTHLLGGTLVAESATAFGVGDVYVSGGTLQSAARGALVLGGALTLLASGTLEIAISAAGQGTVLVSGGAYVDGATLNVTFADGYAPAVGSTLFVLVANELHGRFAHVNVEGFGNVTRVYDGTGLRLRLVAH